MVLNFLPRIAIFIKISNKVTKKIFSKKKLLKLVFKIFKSFFLFKNQKTF